MMLQSLIAYAEREGLGNDPDFKLMPVRWIISLDLQGHVIVPPIELLQDPDAPRPRPKQCLRPFTRTDDIGHGRAHFLCDNPERALGMFEHDGSGKAKGREIQFGYFVELFRNAASACPVVAHKLNAVVKALTTPELLAGIQREVTKARIKLTDNVTFSVDGESLLDNLDLKHFWRDFRKAGSKPNESHKRKKPVSVGGVRVCVATGVLSKPVNTAGKIRGVPNTQASGANLIAFDKASFTSFNLKKAMNASISADADVKVCAALEDLIGKGILIPQFVKPKNKDKQAVHLHWTRKPVEFDPLDPVVSGDPDAIARLLRSVHDGRQIVGLDANAYYALSLSGNGARIIVRDWLESTVPEVEQQVAEWFQDLTIVPPDGVGLKRDFKLGALLYGMVRDKMEELPPQLPTQLLHAALRGAPLPQTALVAALRRQLIEQRKPDDQFDPKLKPARMALIKACLLRSPNRKETDTMTEKLDPESKDCAYLCGQLFAVIGRLQLLALGKVGASLADRTYGGVATRPATTFGPVFTKLPAYLKKANVRFPGSGTNKQKEVETLAVRIEKLGGLPQTLGLEEQGRFALGYYCRLAQYRADRAEAEAAEKAQELTDELI